MNTEASAAIMLMHTTYQALTGLYVSIIQREHVWYEWHRRGLNVADLTLWINEVKKRQSQGRSDSLRFRNLIEDVQKAEENIVELRRMKRGHIPDTDRESVLRTTGRSPAVTHDVAKLVGEVIQKIQSNPEAAEKAFRELQQLKSKL